jgi:ribosomal protein S12 methylthiotransferase
VRREAERLARQGVREVTLIGQDTTSYGDDLGLHHGLATLLRTLAQIPDLVWIRFLYCYPSGVDDPLIEAVAASPKVCRYFDIPFQHASASVLKAMRRGSRGEHFLRLLEKIRVAIPDVTLRTSIIVGFPGESEREFRELLGFVEAAQFDHLGVFTYSNEDTAASFTLPKQVPAPEAAERRRQVMALQRKISRRRLKARVGQSLPVLVEGPAAETEHLLRGRLESQAPEIDGQVFINDYAGRAPQAGEFRWARVTAAGDYDLVARLEARAYAEPQSPRGPADHEARLIQIRPIARGATV